MVKSTTFEVRVPGFKFQLYRLLVLWLSACLTILDLSLAPFKQVTVKSVISVIIELQLWNITQCLLH